MPDTLKRSHVPYDKAKTYQAGLFGERKVTKRSRGVVLIMADDDEDDCILVEAALKDACFRCTFRCVQDGLEMMNYLHRRGQYENPESAPLPDIILLDLNMPKMNGREVLERLKSDPRFRAIPVIILTTSCNAGDVQVCYELGANSYVTKEPTYNGLVGAMKTLTEYWLELATLPPKDRP